MKSWLQVWASPIALVLLAVVLYVALGPLKIADGVITAIATAVIGVFTVVLGATAWNQLRHTREIERAYVTGGGDYARDPVTRAIVVRNGKRVFLVEVANYGKTPLFLSHYDVHFAKLADLKPEANVLCRPVSPEYPFSDRLAPGGHTKPIAEHEIPAGDDVVYGAFWYQDIWRKKVRVRRRPRNRRLIA